MQQGRIDMKNLWNPRTKRILTILVIFAIMYTIGYQVGKVQEVVRTNFLNVINQEVMNWGLGFGEENTVPTGTMSAEELAEYDAYYVGDTQEDTIYLTFDCGFENGNTEAILDALAAHEVSATFFIVGYFLEENPELVLRMIEEGHTVGNHTYNHPDMTLESEEAFIEEIESLADAYQELTGEEISKFYRAPQGKFNEESLAMVQELGYTTFFWSLAYVDWYEDDQPTKEEAFEKLLTRIHPGAIVLLHNTSSTNAEILDELLTEWENMGYEFGSLAEM